MGTEEKIQFKSRKKIKFNNQSCKSVITWVIEKIDSHVSTFDNCLCYTINLVTSQVTLLVKNPSAKAGDVRDVSSVPGLGRSPGGRQGNALQYSSQENSIDRGAWQAAVHGVTKSWT